MIQTAQQKIRFGFWMLTLAPVLLSIMAVRNGIELVDAAQDVARTNEAVKDLEQLLSSLKDIEVGQREYILTGDEQYVRHIGAARDAIRRGVDELDNIRSDRHWLELLKTAIPQKFEEIDKTVALRRSGGMEAAAQMVLKPDSPPAMDDIRKILSNMIAEENSLLRQRSEAQRNRFVRTAIIFAAVLALTIALIWTVFYLIRRETETAQKTNEELERRVELRTEELRRSNEDLQQFAYIASHDLKEPMRMIASYTTLLQRRYQGRLDADADTYIGYVVDGVKRMNNLITNLLDYSKAESQEEGQITQVDAAAVLKSVMENLKVSIADSGATITSDPLPMIVYDRLRLGQLLQNLIGNAIKYRGTHKPRIHISTVHEENETVFSVQDNGTGIPAEHHDQIFGIFQRLHGKEIEGTGIGLAMCKKIVERHGGRIWVESEPGKGSTFFFSVPLEKKAFEESAG